MVTAELPAGFPAATEEEDFTGTARGVDGCGLGTGGYSTCSSVPTQESPREDTSSGGSARARCLLLERHEIEPRGRCSDSMEADLRSARFGCDSIEREELCWLWASLAKTDALGVAGGNAIIVGGGERYIAQRQRRDAASDLLLKVGKLRESRGARGFRQRAT